MKSSIDNVLSQYNIDRENATIVRINSGHINRTFKIGDDYVLQQINRNVFKHPEVISSNLNVASRHLKLFAPDYFFLESIRNKRGADLTFDTEGTPWRLYPFVKNSITRNEVSTPQQAYEAAKSFGQLGRLLSSCDVSLFKETIPQFHNLTLRFQNFEKALAKAPEERKNKSQKVCDGFREYSNLVASYAWLIDSGNLTLRVTHNDTKINNVLFSSTSDKVVCVIDLDTLMPGYFIYDLGDMIRTMASPVSEEEADLTKVVVRRDILDAIFEGYLTEMDHVLTSAEKKITGLAGPMMTFMIGIRFLTDYLEGDTYFQTNYPDQNLIRATNQLCLLQLLS